MLKTGTDTNIYLNDFLYDFCFRVKLVLVAKILPVPKKPKKVGVIQLSNLLFG